MPAPPRHPGHGADACERKHTLPTSDGDRMMLRLGNRFSYRPNLFVMRRPNPRGSMENISVCRSIPICQGNLAQGYTPQQRVSTGQTNLEEAGGRLPKARADGRQGPHGGPCRWPDGPRISNPRCGCAGKQRLDLGPPEHKRARPARGQPWRRTHTNLCLWGLVRACPLPPHRPGATCAWLPLW